MPYPSSVAALRASRGRRAPPSTLGFDLGKVLAGAGVAIAGVVTGQPELAVSGLATEYSGALTTSAPSVQRVNVTVPGGRTLAIQFSGRGPVTGSAQYVFLQWAQQGHLDWVRSVAATGSGPKWDNPSQTYRGYGSVDRAFAQQIVQAYQAEIPAGTLLPGGGTMPATQAGVVSPATTTSIPDTTASALDQIAAGLLRSGTIPAIGSQLPRPPAAGQSTAGAGVATFRAGSGTLFGLSPTALLVGGAALVAVMMLKGRRR